MSHRFAVRAALFFACESVIAACEQGRTRSPVDPADEGGKSGGAVTTGAGGTAGAPATSGNMSAAGSGPQSPLDAAPTSDARPVTPSTPPADAAKPVDLLPDMPAVVTFKNIEELLLERCAGCHEPAEPHVDLTPKGLYARLVGKMPTKGATACRSMILVKAGDPKGSLIYQKVIKGGTLGACGKRMPNGCEPDDCLTDADIKMIGDWITAGAKM